MVIAYPEQDQVLKLDLSKEEFGREILKQRKGTLEYAWRGDRVFAAFQEIPSTKWIIVVRSVYDSLFRDILRLRDSVIFISLAILAGVAVLLTLIVNRSVLRRIRVTTDSLKEIARGDGDLTRASPWRARRDRPSGPVYEHHS
jgi:methyl-accepting chemotaxis protein